MMKFYAVFLVSLMALSHSFLFCDLSQLQGELNILGQSLENLERDLKTVSKKSEKNIKKVADGQYQYADVTIFVGKYDITKMNVNAIVNGANQNLLENPGGVARAIWDAAGKNPVTNEYYLNEWSRKKFNRTDDSTKVIPLGGAIVSPSFDLKKAGIEYIIHAVGPNCGAGQDISELYNTYKNSLLEANKEANKKNVTSIAFPAISTGIFGCGKQQCAKHAIQAIKDTVLQTSIKKVYLSSFVEYYTKYLKDELEK